MLTRNVLKLTSILLIRDMAAKVLDIGFISNKDQVGDIFTAQLSSSHFAQLCDKLKVVSLPLSFRGHVRDIDKPTQQHHI